MDVLYPHRKFSGNASELAEKAIECATNFGWTVDLDKTNERLVRYYVTEGVIDRPDRQGEGHCGHRRCIARSDCHPVPRSTASQWCPSRKSFG